MTWAGCPLVPDKSSRFYDPLELTLSYDLDRSGSSLRRGRRAVIQGFTLIELLVVIAVIGVLATLVAPNVFAHLGGAKQSAARSQVEMLVAALDAYRLDTGAYPSSAEGLDVLWERPAAAREADAWRGPYLRKATPLDPWGNAYVYRFPAQEAPFGFDLLSYGADGEPGGEGEDADVRAWE